MEIGKPTKTIVVEPLKDPVPREPHVQGEQAAKTSVGSVAERPKLEAATR